MLLRHARLFPLIVVLGWAAAALAETPPVVVAGDAGRRADAWLTAAGYSGVVLVARGDEVILRKGYGLADRERGIPMSTDVVWSVGSITKQFTAAAILRLEMDGKLKVEDPIGKFFADVPPDKSGITLHHLLTHTAGLESDFTRTDFDPVGRDEYVRRILASKLRSKPGEAYYYANAGYSLLGVVVEIVSGQGYEAYLREHLFLPAGMRETGYKIPNWPAERVAQGYNGEHKWGTILQHPWDEDGPYWQLRANGGIHTTLDDMLRWHRALLGDTVLSADERRKLFTPYVAEGPGADTHYGYGWSIAESPWGGPLVEHNGGNPVFSADFKRYIDQGLVVVTFSNDATLRAFRVSGPVAHIVMGEDAPPPPRPADEAKAEPLGTSPRHRRILGWYEAYNSGDYAKMKAFRDRNMVAREGGPSEEERQAMFRRMQDDLGQLEPRGAVALDGERIEVPSRAGSEMPARLTFFFEPGEEGRITQIGIQVGD